MACLDMQSTYTYLQQIIKISLEFLLCCVNQFFFKESFCVTGYDKLALFIDACVIEAYGCVCVDILLAVISDSI